MTQSFNFFSYIEYESIPSNSEFWGQNIIKWHFPTNKFPNSLHQDWISQSINRLNKLTNNPRYCQKQNKYLIRNLTCDKSPHREMQPTNSLAGKRMGDSRVLVRVTASHSTAAIRRHNPIITLQYWTYIITLYKPLALALAIFRLGVQGYIWSKSTP